jgi:alcohol dehydrogenase (cytochrome c)
MFYFLADEDCSIYSLKPEKFTEGHTYYSTGVRHSSTDQLQKILLAFDLEGSQPAWRYVQAGSNHSSAGVMSTAGGLVFFGDNSQSLEAVDAGSGKPLWHFNTGQTMHASPMTFAVRGKQYVAIAAGSDLFTFALP